MKNAHILTTGDVVRDIATYQGDTVFPAEPGKITPHFTDRLGGAKQLHEFIKAAVGDGEAVFGLKRITPATRNRTHPAVHTLWEPCAGGLKKEHEGTPKDQRPKDVWRVAKPLGYALLDSQHGEPPLERSTAAAECPCVLVIDDAGLGFRTIRAKDRWPLVILQDEWRASRVEEQALQPDWIVLKMSNPVAQGDLWRELSRLAAAPSAEGAPPKNLVVITSANELRRAGAAISRGYSWERTLTELCAELQDHPAFRPLLAHSGHLIVNFECEGAVWFDNDCHPAGSSASSNPQQCAHLIYDPTLAEGRWESLLANDARVYGHLNAFTGAIAIGLFDKCRDSTVASGVKCASDSEPPPLDNAIRCGLNAVRTLRLCGHGASHEKPDVPPPALTRVLGSARSARAADAGEATQICKRVAPRGYATVAIPNALDISSRPDWTLAALSENAHDSGGLLNLPLYGLAHRVALYGLDSLGGVPRGRFGNLVSIDRYEIETLRGLHQRIDAYVRIKQPKQPLCLAAFGPPGAGKSYGIKEIAKEILGAEPPPLEFNLSQFHSPAMLIGAFHQVRDAVLKGKTPVVFWDEFDCQDYKWLQYLLAPMQDGAFQEDGCTHTLGKCIFVFAGGTSWDFEHFGPAPMPPGWSPVCSGSDAERLPLVEEDGPDEGARQAIARLGEFYRCQGHRVEADQKANEEFRQKKGPDFLSRLDGYINVLGPNRRRLYDWSARQWTIDDMSDITFPVRRALLLRIFLGAKKDQDRLDMDRDLLRAFLHVPRYRHGARSLEKIALPLAESRRPYRRAFLPPPQIVQQHLDSAAEFDRIYRGNLDFLSTDNLRAIAAAIADYFDRTFGGAPTRTREEALAAFDDKDPWDQATNIAAAQRLPDVLALAGLRLVPGKATSDEIVRIKAHLERHLSVLAEEEHVLWMIFHQQNGWQEVDPDTLAKLEGLEKNDETAWKTEIKRLKKKERRHTLIVPFEKLSEHDKRKDYDSIRNYPDMADLVGWKIAFVDD